MIDRSVRNRQPDLPVSTPEAPESSRIPPPTLAEVTALLKLLMSEHIAVAAALPPEAANE